MPMQETERLLLDLERVCRRHGLELTQADGAAPTFTIRRRPGDSVQPAPDAGQRPPDPAQAMTSEEYALIMAQSRATWSGLLPPPDAGNRLHIPTPPAASKARAPMVRVRRALWLGFSVFTLAEAAIVWALFKSSWFTPTPGLLTGLPRAATLGLIIALTAIVTGSFVLLQARVREAQAMADELADASRRLSSMDRHLAALHRFREARRA